MRVQLLPNRQITLPAKICRLLGLKIGDFLEPQIKDQNIVLKTKKIDPQAWFWTKEWQAKEKEADKAIARGEIAGPFDNVEDLIKELNQ